MGDNPRPQSAESLSNWEGFKPKSKTKKGERSSSTSNIPSKDSLNDDATPISVCIRVRPLNESEKECGSAWKVEGKVLSIAVDETGSRATYEYEHVFDEEAKQQQVYDFVKPVVASALQGFHGCIFAYGQTSAGKTFTMQGAREQAGIIPRAILELFHHVQSQSERRRYTVRMSYLELYNEDLYDLLIPPEDQKSLQVRERAEGGVYVDGAREEVVASFREATNLLSEGLERRHIAATQLNRQSSRSHTILRLVMESKNKTGSAVRSSTLAMVDLAGSERAKRLQGRARLTEGCYINKSLLTLGIIIRKLASDPGGVKRHAVTGGAADQHVPYRDSKLTRLLQPALGGNAKAAVVCCMTPAKDYTDHTRATLKFAQRCSRVCNYAVVNETSTAKAVLLRNYASEVSALREQLANMAHIAAPVQQPTGGDAELKALLLRSQKQIESLQAQLQQSQAQLVNSEQSRMAALARGKIQGDGQTTAPQPTQPQGVESAPRRSAWEGSEPGGGGNCQCEKLVKRLAEVEKDRDAALLREKELRAGREGRDDEVETELLAQVSRLRSQLAAAHAALKQSSSSQMAVVEQVEEVAERESHVAARVATLEQQLEVRDLELSRLRAELSAANAGARQAEAQGPWEAIARVEQQVAEASRQHVMEVANLKRELHSALLDLQHRPRTPVRDEATESRSTVSAETSTERGGGVETHEMGTEAGVGPDSPLVESKKSLAVQADDYTTAQGGFMTKVAESGPIFGNQNVISDIQRMRESMEEEEALKEERRHRAKIRELEKQRRRDELLLHLTENLTAPPPPPPPTLPKPPSHSNRASHHSNQPKSRTQSKHHRISESGPNTVEDASSESDGANFAVPYGEYDESEDMDMFIWKAPPLPKPPAKKVLKEETLTEDNMPDLELKEGEELDSQNPFNRFLNTPQRELERGGELPDINEESDSSASSSDAESESWGPELAEGDQGVMRFPRGGQQPPAEEAVRREKVKGGREESGVESSSRPAGVEKNAERRREEEKEESPEDRIQAGGMSDIMRELQEAEAALSKKPDPKSAAQTSQFAFVSSAFASSAGQQLPQGSKSPAFVTPRGNSRESLASGGRCTSQHIPSREAPMDSIFSSKAASRDPASAVEVEQRGAPAGARRDSLKAGNTRHAQPGGKKANAPNGAKPHTSPGKSEMVEGWSTSGAPESQGTDSGDLFSGLRDALSTYPATPPLATSMYDRNDRGFAQKGSDSHRSGRHSDGNLWETTSVTSEDFHTVGTANSGTLGKETYSPTKGVIPRSGRVSSPPGKKKTTSHITEAAAAASLARKGAPSSRPGSASSTRGHESLMDQGDTATWDGFMSGGGETNSTAANRGRLANSAAVLEAARPRSQIGDMTAALDAVFEGKPVKGVHGVGGQAAGGRDARGERREEMFGLKTSPFDKQPASRVDEMNEELESQIAALKGKRRSNASSPANEARDVAAETRTTAAGGQEKRSKIKTPKTGSLLFYGSDDDDDDDDEEENSPAFPSGTIGQAKMRHDARKENVPIEPQQDDDLINSIFAKIKTNGETAQPQAKPPRPVTWFSRPPPASMQAANVVPMPYIPYEAGGMSTSTLNKVSVSQRKASDSPSVGEERTPESNQNMGSRSNSVDDLTSNNSPSKASGRLSPRSRMRLPSRGNTEELSSLADSDEDEDEILLRQEETPEEAPKKSIIKEELDEIDGLLASLQVKHDLDNIHEIHDGIFSKRNSRKQLVGSGKSSRRNSVSKKVEG